MATGGDSCSEGHEFESQHHILDGHFYTYSCCKNCNDVCLKKPEVNYKRGPGSPIFKKKHEATMLSMLDRSYKAVESVVVVSTPTIVNVTKVHTSKVRL